MFRIACLLYEGFLLLDAAGPLTAFEIAGHCGSAGYAIELLAAEPGLARSSSGVKLEARAVGESAGYDTLLVPGGFGARDPDAYPGLLQVIRDAAASGRRVASVCSGAFLLAEAGILDGRRAATHWGEAAELARRHPTIEVDDDSLFLREGNIWTSAGITAGIDLALALIEQDYGVEVARATARGLVVPFRRSGGQSQHSVLAQLIRPDNRFGELLAWARARLGEPLSVERLAERAGLSVRQFTRAFTRSVGVAPAKAIERMRLESARAAIETAERPLQVIARDHGFGDADRMRRAFTRAYGEPPRTFRRGARGSMGAGGSHPSREHDAAGG